MLVGDTQRVWVYADRGFAIPQPVTPEALHAYERLVPAGFTRRIVALSAGKAPEALNHPLSGAVDGHQ